jgi:hypothetical protein
MGWGGQNTMGSGVDIPWVGGCQNTVFSFEAGNRLISLATAIKSPAMNFSSMGCNVQK